MHINCCKLREIFELTRSFFSCYKASFIDFQKYKGLNLNFEVIELNEVL
jgi:hypothetical protein